MGKTRAELKLQAKRALAGKYGTAAGSMLILYAIMFIVILIMEFVMMGVVFSGLTLGSGELTAAYSTGLIIFMFVFLMVFMYLNFMLMIGFTRLYYNITTNQPYGLGDVFFAFHRGNGRFYILSGILLLLYAATIVIVIISSLASMAVYAVFMLVFYVFCIWFSLIYGMFFIIMVENPEIGIVEALGTSARIMKGNKGRYFVLMLSFIGWFIMMYFTLFIGALWIVPYMSCTVMAFYLDIKGKAVIETLN